MSQDPGVAVLALPLLRLTVKNYANLLLSLSDAAGVEQRVSSGWGALFHPVGSSAVMHELAWICRFFDAAATDGFGLDQARSFMQQGRPFLQRDADTSSGKVKHISSKDVSSNN